MNNFNDRSHPPSVWALTTRPEVMANTLETAYSMARACLCRLMCLSTTPCTKAPSRKLTWPTRTMLRPIFIRALVSSREPQHIPEQPCNIKKEMCSRYRKQVSTSMWSREYWLGQTVGSKAQKKTSPFLLMINCWAHTMRGLDSWH